MSLKGLQLSLAWEINASYREILQVYKDLVLEGMPAPTPPVDLIDWVCVKSGRFTHSQKGIHVGGYTCDYPYFFWAWLIYTNKLVDRMIKYDEQMHESDWEINERICRYAVNMDVVDDFKTKLTLISVRKPTTIVWVRAVEEYTKKMVRKGVLDVINKTDTPLINELEVIWVGIDHRRKEGLW